MPIPKPEAGLVIHYSYLWHDESVRGLEEGVKRRPCVVVSAKPSATGDIVVTVVPITHRPPTFAGNAVEIPAVTKRRLGLDELRSWVVVNDLNRFHWPGPDLRSLPRRSRGVFDYGFLPPALFRSVAAGIANAARESRLRTTAR